MADDILFYKYDLRKIIENQRSTLRAELDGMPESRLLNTDLAELQSYAAEKYRIDVPLLGEPVVDEGRTKMQVGRWGGYPTPGEPTVQVDAHRYTLEIPFEGDKDLFYTQGSSFTSDPPRGTVRDGLLTTTIVERDPNAEKLNQQFDRFLSDIDQHLGWLKGEVDAWNAAISGEVATLVQYRREKAEQAGSIASGLKFGVRQRSDRASTFVAPVAQRKKITPQLPPAKPGAPPEPALSDEMYRAILDTLKQMSNVMERSPHAYATMDEETLRFQFLVPLNAHFECEARAEVFNYGGKTDILITVRGRNIFICECKFWKGAKSLTDTVDQIIGYLAWRDTKCAILVFNRNRQFSQVLAQVRPTLEQHPQFVSFDGISDETEMSLTFNRPDDPERKLKLTVLAFDIPAPGRGVSPSEAARGSPRRDRPGICQPRPQSDCCGY